MIRTPWGEIEVGDAHVHFFSPAFFSSLGDGAPSLGWDVPASPENLAQRWVAELDREGVDRAVLIASTPTDSGSANTAVELYPARFTAVAMTDPSLPYGVTRNAFLFPAMHRFALHDDKVWSLVQMLAGYPGSVVYVHCGVLSMGFRRKLGLPCHFDMRFSNPADLHGLAVNFPQVTFVIPHFGAGYFREALMVADVCPNVYLDTSSSNSWLKYQPDSLDLDGVFRRCLQVLGPKRLLFGTDSSFFPRGWVRQVFESQAESLLRAGADEEAARAIFGGNLRALLWP